MAKKKKNNKKIKSKKVKKPTSVSSTYKPNDYLSCADAGKYHNVTRQTIYNKVQAGEIPYIKLADRIRIKFSDVEQITFNKPPGRPVTRLQVGNVVYDMDKVRNAKARGK